MVYVLDPTLYYGDMGGYFHVVDMTDGTAYDPGNGPYPIVLGAGAGIESSPMPDYAGLIYIGNNDGKVFIIDESAKQVIKTYDLGSGIHIGDIGYNGDNDCYIVPTNEGKIYYLPAETDPTP